MVERIHVRWPLEPLGRPRGGTAQRWNYRDGAGSIGVIASISEPFCGDCNRLRVTADGQAFTCLFSADGMDLKPVLSSEPCLEQAVRDLWQRRQDRYSEERDTGAASTHAEMAYLGG
jgi:cyclic pyranopterin phosphate synthase